MITNVRPAYRANRKMLLISCAIAALATATVLPQKARAQAFQGTISSSTNASQTSIGAGTETITVTNPTATIDWTASNNDFLPAANTATFTSSSGVTDYTVLNRIVPADSTNPILLNGHVISTLEGSSSIGGNIWFYAPSGIVVGSGAVFDVGGLLLSSINPTLIGNDSNGFSASFSRQTGDGGTVEIMSGAQINALRQNSYVALVAPKVVQGGTIKVDGSAAYVAANNLTMTMNQGLFDIQVDVAGGTDDAQGVVHSGSTTGGDTASLSANHKVYMVAVPKNQALTMLLGGTVGFDAGVAGYENGQIVLSSGWSAYSNGSFSQASAVAASINIGAANFTSSVDAIATSDIIALADSGNITFADGVNFSAGDTAELGAVNGFAVSVTGDANLTASGWDGSGGDALIFANNNGSVDITGNLSLTAAGVSTSGNPGYGGSAVISASAGTVSVDGTTAVNVGVAKGTPSEGQSEDSQGGTATISATNGGGINLHDTSIYAFANGQDNNGNGDTTAGDGIGGQINLLTSGGGSITVAGNLYANADGYGGDMDDGSTLGGTGYGGLISLEKYNGSIDVTGTTTLTAYGIGGDWLGSVVPVTAQGGDGYGGNVYVYSGGPGSISLEGNVNLSSDGTGGDGQSGGDGYGGDAGIYADDGTIALGPQIGASAAGNGGDASSGFGGDGGYGQGGTAYIEALAYPGDIESAATFGTITGGVAVLNVVGAGGDGGAGNGDNIAAGNGGDGQGGAYQGEVGSGGAFAAASNPGASLTLGYVNLVADAIGGNGGTGGLGQAGGAGGNAYGGSAQAGNYDPYSTGANSGTATFDFLRIQAAAHAGNGGSGDAGQGDGGDAYGGTTFINAKGTVNITNGVEDYALAIGGDGANGGDAYGGYGLIQSFAGSQLNIGGDVELHVYGRGGTGTSGNGGNAYGGNIDDGGIYGITAAGGGSITIDGTLDILAAGWAGDGAINGGYGQGGAAYVQADANSSVAISGPLNMVAEATGGAGSTRGGDATGGTVVLQSLAGSSLTVGGAAFLTANATGGNGSTGSGGDAQAGEISVAASGGGAIAVAGALELLAKANAGGLGGEGAVQGGNGQGGAISLTVDGGSISAGSLGMRANGWGGNGVNGGAGGAGSGGTVNVTLTANGGTLDVTGTSTLRAFGTGGNGGENFEGFGGAGGDGYGGSVVVQMAAGSADLGDSEINVNGLGGNGGNGSSGGNGGDGYGGSALLQVDGGAFSAADMFTSARGFGGDGGGGCSCGTGGNGGYGEGGSNTVSLAAGATIDASTYFATANGFGGGGGGIGGGWVGAGAGGSAQGGTNDVTIAGDATFGGNSADYTGFVVTAFAQGGGGGVGGYATGGTSSIVVDGSVSVDGLIQSTGSAAGGDAADVGGYGSGGSGSITANGTLTAGSAYVAANGFGGSAATEGGASGGSANLYLNGGSVTQFGDVDMSAAGTGGHVGITGDLNATGFVNLEAGGYITFENVSAYDFNFQSEGAITGGNITAVSNVGGNANGAISLGDITVGPDAPASDSDGFSVGIGSATSISVGDVTAVGNIGFATLGELTTGDLSAGNTVLIMASGDIATGSITTAADGRVYLADGSMFVANGGGGEDDNFDPNVVLALNPVATGGSIIINGPVTTGRFQAAAGTGFTLGNVNAAQSVELSAGGNLSSGALTAGAAISLVADGSIATGDLDAGTAATLNAGGDTSVDDVTAATASFTAGGTANFYGVVAVPTITVTSGDITSASGASLGVEGLTTLITLNAVTAGGVYVGSGFGEIGAGSYVLNEDGDIASDALVLNALAIGDGQAPDIVLGDLQIEGSETDGRGVGDVTANTAGSIIVVGAVDFINAAAGDSLTFNAGDTIEVITDTGSIAMTDSSGGLSGVLALNANNVWVADQAIIDQLEANPNYTGRDADLASNGGTANPDGYVAAGAIEAAIADTMFVQNSGTSDALAGLTVGDGGLTIASAGDGSATVDVYGKQVNPDGTTVTGDAFANGVETSGTFASGSAINGCAIGTTCGQVTPPPSPPPVTPPPSPPPVTPPPSPPPVTPPPSPPPSVSGSDSVLGTLGNSGSPLALGSENPGPDQDQDEDSSDGSDGSDSEEQTSIDVTLGLTGGGPAPAAPPIDDPITSGSDAVIGDGPGGSN